MLYKDSLRTQENHKDTTVGQFTIQEGDNYHIVIPLGIIHIISAWKNNFAVTLMQVGNGGRGDWLIQLLIQKNATI